MESYGRERGVAVIPTVSGPTDHKARGSTPGAECLEPELDGRAVQQALVNVIDNAIKHSPPGSSVRVRLELAGINNGVPAPAVIRFAVEDNGPGIPLAEQERIFERFHRLGSELRRETEGVGIGLSIVKHVVEAHGGRVRVESEVGKGSTFLLEFPYEPKSMA
jgi:two-component system phosphate regulon sensor histidine kinase PhoR